MAVQKTGSKTPSKILPVLDRPDAAEVVVETAELDDRKDWSADTLVPVLAFESVVGDVVGDAVGDVLGDAVEDIIGDDVEPVVEVVGDDSDGVEEGLGDVVVDVAGVESGAAVWADFISI
jgi:hypothetical protein